MMVPKAFSKIPDISRFHVFWRGYPAKLSGCSSGTLQAWFAFFNRYKPGKEGFQIGWGLVQKKRATLKRT